MNRRRNTDDEIMSKIADEIKALRTESGVTLEELGAFFYESRASIHKLEKKNRYISLIKYLGIVWFFHDWRPNHPALPYIRAIGVRKLNEMIENSDHPNLRLSDYLETVDLTRCSSPNHPALPLADYILYE